MRDWLLALGACLGLATSTAMAHGPQIQITDDNNKIVTRQLILDAPYSNSLTSTKSVYVMPLVAFGGVSYSRPNGTLDPGTLLPLYFSGPGLTYGYDLADGGPQVFTVDSVISVDLLDGLKLWNGAAFVDAGATQLKAFRGSNVNITSPAANLAITTDSGPFDSLSLATVALNYDPEGSERHGSFNWALLGDGTSPTSASPDGVYLLKLQVSSSQAGLSPSDPYYFVLRKNVPPATVNEAVKSLGVAPSLVQFVPEPGSWMLGTIALIGVAILRRISRKPARD